MRGPIRTYWGKLGPRGDDGMPLSWHPLYGHCADVAAVFRAVLDQPVIRRWLAALARLPDLTPVQCDRLAILAALHDVGKVNLGFWGRWRPGASPVGHVAPVLLLLLDRVRRGPEQKQMFEALGFEKLAPWAVDQETFFDLLLTAISHHGRPIKPQPIPGSARYWQPSGGLDPIAGAAGLRQEAEVWFPGAFGDATPFPAHPAFQHGFNGLLTLADWIASDEALFPFSEEGDGDRFPWARERADVVLQRLGLKADAPRSALGEAVPGFAAVSEHEPRDLQTRLLELPTGTGGSVAVLEAETGSGKTEAALARFLRLFHAGLVDGLYFGLPTRTAATQIHERVRAAVQRAFPHPSTPPPVVLAVPGYLKVDDARGERVDRFQVRWEHPETTDDEEEPRLATPDALWPDEVHDPRRWRGWAAENSKRFLAGAVVVGTVDQALLSALAVSHSHMRAAALSRHLLVVDEVHASDAYMTAILAAVLERHVGARGHALLMSATLGAAARERLLAPGRAIGIPPLDEAVSMAYPLLTHASPPGAEAAAIHIAASRTSEVRVERAPIAADHLAVARWALEAARQGARVLVIRNTVRDCVATQQALEALVACTEAAREPRDQEMERNDGRNLLFGCAGVRAPHHSRYSREDRRILDREIERRFGKHSAEGGCVAVATQTVQQSLDLDADLMLTDVCPMDVLLQRIGRLFRHDRTRPKGFEEASVVVLVPTDRDLGRFLKENGEARGPHGIGTVYRDLRVLEATWRQLEAHPRIAIPRMNRTLVEATTHPEALEAITNELGGPWSQHGQTVVGIVLAHGRIAGNHLARWDVPFPNAIFPDDGVRIAARLGAEDRVAEFDGPLDGPFGEPVWRVTIPHWLAQGADADARPIKVEADNGVISFRFGERRYRYDRLGLAALGRSTPNEEEDHG